MRQQTEIGKIWPEQEEDAFPAPVDFRELDYEALERAMRKACREIAESRRRMLARVKAARRIA